jgi:hypothetical protein
MADRTTTTERTSSREREEKNHIVDQTREPISEKNSKDQSKEAKKVDKNNARTSLSTSSPLINSPINANNWQQIRSLIGAPSNHVLTKEDYELVNAVLSAYEYVIMHNIMDFIKQASTNACFHERLLKFVTILKIGASLNQFKQIRLNALIQALTQQANMYISALQQLGTVASSFSNAYILRQYISVTPPVTDIQIPNIALDIKVSSIITTLIGAIVAIGTEIGNLKNDIRSQIALDEYCLQGCSSPCIGFSDITESYNEYRKLLSNSNEGEALKPYADKAIEWLDKLVAIELALVKDQIAKKVDTKPPKQ